MSAINHFELFSDDPAEFNKKDLKLRLTITLIQLIRARGWSQVVASQKLMVSQPRISNLMRGKIELFSIDALLEMIFRAGYSFDYLFDLPSEASPEPRLELKLKKATL